jgi:hypothetical protein
VYGQGMTSAALQTMALDELLKENISDDKLAKKFFSKAAKAFLKVMSLLNPPGSLLHPKIAWRVLFG